MTEIILFLLTVVLASFVQSFIGFGLGIVMISLMPFFMTNITSSVCISNFTSVFLSGQNSISYRKQISVKRILPILIPYCVSNTLTIVFLKGLKNDTLKIILGIFLILYSICFLIGIFNFKMKRNAKNGIIAGLISGVLGGLFGTGGPPISVYLMQSSDGLSEYQADIQLYFTLANIYSLIIRLINGQITLEVLKFVAIGIPATVLGAFLGKKLLKKFNGNSIKKYLYIFLIINGFILIFT